MTPATLSALLIGGDLTITDIDGTGKNNALSVSVSGANLVITDTVEQFVSAPAGGTLSNGDKTLTIPLTSVTGTLTIDGAGGDDTLTVNALPGLQANLTITGGTGTDSATFAGAITLADGKSILVDVSATISLSTSSSDLAASGAGTISLTTARNIVLANGSSVTTVNGNLTLSANQQATPTAGGFTGIDISGLVESSGSGVVTVQGRGNGLFGVGVLLQNGGDISGGTAGTTLVNGTIVTTSGFNRGVQAGAGSIISSAGADVQVIGAAGTGTGDDNYGVFVADGAVITAGGTGAVTVQGTGGVGGSRFNFGVQVGNSGSLITSNDGPVTVTGVAGGSAGGDGNSGVVVVFGGQIRSGGVNTVAVTGTGGPGVGSNFGVDLEADGGVMALTSGGGDIVVTGVRGDGTATTSPAIVLINATINTAANGGNVTLIGDSMDLRTGITTQANGSVSLRPQSAGFAINLGGNDTASQLGLSDSKLDLITTGTIQVGDTNSGPITVSSAISVDDALSLTTASNQTITLSATLSTDAGANARNVTFNAAVVLGANVTVDVDHASGADGNVTFNGTVNADNSTTTDRTLTVSAGGGTVNVLADVGTGTNGALAAATLTAATINLAGSIFRAQDGDGFTTTFGGAVVLQNNVTIDVSGGGENLLHFASTINADDATANDRVLTLEPKNLGVTLAGSIGNSQPLAGLSIAKRAFIGGSLIRVDDGSAGTISFMGGATLQNNVTIDGDGTNDKGVHFEEAVNADATANNRDLTIVAPGNLVRYKSGFGSSSGVRPNDVTISSAGNVSIELPSSITGNLTQSAGTGTFTVGATTTVGGDVDLSTNQIILDAAVNATGTARFATSAANGFQPRANGVDVTSSTLSFGSGTDLQLTINGTTVDAQYRQLNVVGMVDLTGVDLVLSAGFTPATSDSFILVNNDGTDPVTGTFNGLAEGALVTLSGVQKRLTYIGGTGNDVVLTNASTLSAVLASGDLTITDTDGTGKDNSLTVSVSGSDLVITDANEAFASAPAGGTLSNSNKTLTIPLASVTGTLTLNALNGSDTIAVNALPGFLAGLTVDGAGGSDTVNLNGDVTFASGKSLVVNVETVNVGAGADLTTSAAGVITLTADDVSLNATSTLTSTATVTVQQQTGGRGIDLGTETAGQLSLTDAELDRVTASTLQIGNGANSGTITVSAALSHGNNLSLTTGAGVTFNNAVTMAANKSLTVTALGTSNGTINLANANADLSATGAGGITLTTARNISLAGSASIVTQNGNLTLAANQQTTPTGGHFSGVAVSGTVQSTGAGNVTVTGRGGNDAAGTQHGVSLLFGTIQSGSGEVNVTGTGGASTGNSNFGVKVDRGGTITSTGGPLLVVGTGGGVGSTSGLNVGVGIGSTFDNERITNTGTGTGATITVIGTGGMTGGALNYGVSADTRQAHFKPWEFRGVEQGNGRPSQPACV